MDTLHFVEVASSRLCHDLITPVGAINTGLELLEDMDPHDKDRDDVLALIQQSAKTASTRLAFYRAAFGASGARLSVDEAWQLIERFAQTSRVNVHLDNQLSEPLPLLSRLRMNTYLWIHECLPRGGDFYCTLQEKEMTLRASGQPITVQEEAKDSLLRLVSP